MKAPIMCQIIMDEIGRQVPPEAYWSSDIEDVYIDGAPINFLKVAEVVLSALQAEAEGRLDAIVNAELSQGDADN